MAQAPVGIDVKPNIEGFSEHLKAALFVLAARDMLEDFAKWLLKDEPGEGHEAELVNKYIDARTQDEPPTVATSD